MIPPCPVAAPPPFPLPPTSSLLALFLSYFLPSPFRSPLFVFTKYLTFLYSLPLHFIVFTCLLPTNFFLVSSLEVASWVRTFFVAQSGGNESLQFPHYKVLSNPTLHSSIISLSNAICLFTSNGTERNYGDFS